MGERWINKAERAARTWVGWLATTPDPGCLEWLPLDARAFHAGHRTGDRGDLGEPAGVLTVEADEVNSPVTWRLRDPSTSPAPTVAETTLPGDAPVEIWAADGGPYILECRPEPDGDDEGQILVSAPYLVAVDAAREHLDPAFDALDPNMDDSVKERIWDSLLATAEDVAAHSLRPLNVRLLWDADELWGDADAFPGPGDDRLIARRQGDSDEEPRLRRILIDAPSPPDAGPIDDWYDRLDRDPGFWDRLLSPGALGLASNRSWNYIGSLENEDVGIVVEGLGGLTAKAEAVANSDSATDADGALAALWKAADAPNDGEDNGGAIEAERFGEIAGRRLGVCVARAVCRLVGMRQGLLPGVPGVDPEAIPALTDLLDLEPADPVRDLLGLHRPPDADPDDLAADLNAQDGEGDADRWFDLVEHYAAVWEVSDGRMTAYDVLAGLVSIPRLDQAQILAPLPAPYGRHTLQHGNRDADVADDGTINRAAEYGEDGEDEDGRVTAIADLRADLRRIGITLHEAAEANGRSLAVRPESRYAYRRWQQAANGDAHWEGELHAHAVGVGDAADHEAIRRGHTDWVVREFQIAMRYPNRVVERLDATERYADRLRVSFGDPGFELPTHGIPAGGNEEPEDADDDEEDDADDEEDEPDPGPPVDGRLSVHDALELRRWVLSRQRYPIVVEARRGDTVDHENLMNPDAITTRASRMSLTDKSGYAEGGERVPVGRFGDHSRTNWQGPWMPQSDAQLPFTLAQTFGDDSRVWDADEADTVTEEARCDDVLAAFRVVGALALVESDRHFDGFNAYDDAVFSYPPFHFTLGLGLGKPALMAAFVRWLQHPPQALPADLDDAQREAVHEVMRREYQRAFGFFGVGAGALNSTKRQGFLHVGGLRRPTNAQGEVVDMTATWPGGAVGRRQEALYQAYKQWFRTWPWFARFASALRDSEDLRRLVFAYSVHWIHRRLTAHGRNVIGQLQSERALVAYLRLDIRASSYGGHFWRAWQQQGVNLDNVLTEALDEAYDSTYARAYNTAHENLDNDDDRQRVRDDLDDDVYDDAYEQARADGASEAEAEAAADAAVEDAVEAQIVAEAEEEAEEKAQGERNGLDGSYETTCRALAYNTAIGNVAQCEDTNTHTPPDADELGALSDDTVLTADEWAAVRDRVLRSLVPGGLDEPEDDEDDEEDDGDAPEGN